MSYTKITNFAIKDSTNDIIKGTEFDDEFNSIEASFTAQPSATQTLTNKTIALGSNTVSGTFAQFNTAVTDAELARTDAANTFTGTQTFGDLTTTGNTILGNASTDTLNVGNGDLIKDASGNVGVGVTPSAWGSPLAHAIELAQGTGITAHSGSATSYYTSNAYYNGSNWIYKSSVKATLMTMSGSDGSFGWNTAPSGTAGNAITFTQAMSLDASGNLSNVGTYNNSRIVGGTYAITTGNSLTITLATGALTNRGAFMVIGGVTQGVGSHTGLYVIGGNANLVSTVLAATNIAVTSNTTAGTIIITNNTGQTMNGNYFVTS